MKKIYIAASSSEIDRAKKWMDRCREAGIEVVSTWVENITQVGNANPISTSTREQRFDWAARDLNEVAQGQAFWLMLPEKPTSGAWVEFGYALALKAIEVMATGQDNRWVLCSGTERSIFSSLAEHYATDEEAFAALTQPIPTIELNIKETLKKKTPANP